MMGRGPVATPDGVRARGAGASLAARRSRLGVAAAVAAAALGGWQAGCGSDADGEPVVGCEGQGGCGAGGGAAGQGAGGAAAGHTPASEPGGTRWSRHLAGVSDRYAVWAAPAPGGDVVVTGFFVGTLELGGAALSSGESWASAEPAWAIFVARFDPRGTHVWSKRFGGQGASRPQSVAVDDKGGVALAGAFTGELAFGDATLASPGRSSLFVARLDPQGAPLWARQAGDSGEQAASAVAFDQQGNVVVAGSLGGSADLGGGPLQSAGGRDVLVAKLDSTGAHLWSKRFGDAAAQQALGLAVDADNSLVLTGSLAGSLDLGGGPLQSAGGTDLFVARLDGAGNHVWSLRAGDAASQIGRAVALDAQRNIAVAGEFGGQLDLGEATGEPGAPLAQCSGPATTAHPTTGRCYARGGSDRSHPEAAAACAALGPGWTLATPEQPSELAFLAQTYPLPHLWLGATDEAGEGAFTWASGAPFAYPSGQPPWNEGEPNGGPAENCLELTSGRLNDVACADPRPYVCQRIGDPPSGAGGAGGAAGSSGSSGQAGAAGDGGAGGAGGAAAGQGGAPVSPTALRSRGGLDAFVLRLDPRGRKLWGQSLGADDDQRAWTVTHDAAGNVVLSGDVAGDLALPGAKLADGHVLVASYDASGKLRWAERFGPGLGQGLSLARAGDQLVLTGIFSRQLDLGQGALDAGDHIGTFLAALSP